MKSTIKIFMLIGILMTFFTCSNDDNELGRILDPSELDFTVVQDYSIDEGGNTVILINNTPETVPVWDYGTGVSNRAIDTIRYAFAGDYTIKFSAVTDGGVVDAEPIPITVTEDNLNYVNDPLWTLLSGGVGNSKTWLLDVDADGVSKYFGGPMFFYGTDNGWLEGGEDGCYGDDCWNWSPDLNSILGWGFSGPADFGEMTFSLEGGPYMTVNHLTLPQYGEQSGTYFLDKDNYTLTTSNATILHDSAYEDCVSNWNSLVILSLTEDAMQLGVIRDCDPAMLSFNFISQEYSDNWVPEETGPEEPTLPGGWEDIISEITTTAIEWKLSESNPLDWATLGGNMMNGWQAPEDYPDWLGTPDPAVYGDFSMTLNSVDNTVAFVSPDGTTTDGTYAINNSGIYSFSVPVPSFQLINWAYFGADANNELRILRIDTDPSGNVSDMWLGALDDVNNPTQYTAFHLVPNVGGSGGGGDVEGDEIPVDNSKIVFGDLETSGKFRIEIYNQYGSTSADSPIDQTLIPGNNTMEVTFTLSGVDGNLVEGASGSYNAAILYFDTAWASGNTPSVTVTGDGTYTVSINSLPAGDCGVFTIDIPGLGDSANSYDTGEVDGDNNPIFANGEVVDVSAVTATVESIVVY